MTRFKDFAATFAKSAARNYSAVLSDGAPDRESDRINPRGWVVNEPVPPLVGHDTRMLPVGRVSGVHPVGNTLRADRVEFPPEGVSAVADEAERLVASGYAPAVSVGFRPLKAPTKNEFGGYDFSCADLIEVSLVACPANLHAVIERTADDGVLRKWWDTSADDVLDVDFTPDELARLAAHAAARRHQLRYADPFEPVCDQSPDEIRAAIAATLPSVLRSVMSGSDVRAAIERELRRLTGRVD